MSVTPAYMKLDDPVLGTLDLSGCGNGYVVTGWDVGFPDVRAVTENIALADGVNDETSLLGGCAVTVTIMLDQRVADVQTLRDRLVRYVIPRYRPTLSYVMPGSTQIRSLRALSGRNGGIQIQRAKYHTVPLQWLCPSGKAFGPDPVVLQFVPTSDTELGRVYNENYADGGRGPYPASAGIGARLVSNIGNDLADFQAQIFGPCVNPTLRVNGISVTFDQNGGVTLLGGESIVFDTKARTIYKNGDPTQSLYDRSNFTTWSWQSLKLLPGDNNVRVSATSGSVTMQLTYEHTWVP